MKYIISNPIDFDRAALSAEDGDTIYINAGVVAETKGNWWFPNFLTLKAGVNLEGDPGAGLKFSAAPATTALSAPRVAKDLNILWAGGRNKITGIKFDCMPPLGGWNGGGLRFDNRYIVSGCEIVGLRGNWQDQVEVFAISSQGDTCGSTVDQVKVHSVEPNSYVSGIYIGGTVPPSDPNKVSRVTNCSVDLGMGNQFGFSCTYKTKFIRCETKGGAYGLYTDTGHMIAELFECDLRSSYAAISSTQAAAGTVIRQVYANKCKLISARGVEWFDKTPGKDRMVGGVCVTDSEIDAEYTVAVDGRTGAVVMADVELARPYKDAITQGSIYPVVML